LLKCKQFVWSETAQQAFDEVKLAMTRTPVLGLPDFTQPFTLETDACNDGIGAVLMQQGRPISYLSKDFGDKHRSLSIYEKELLALIMAVEKWRPYLQRQEFTILTDHKSLSFLNEQNLHSELQRKAMTRLMGLYFKIVYKKDKEIVVADALSRVAHLLAVQAVSTVQPVWIQEVLNSYTTDPKAQLLMKQLVVSSPDANGFNLEQGLIRHNGTIWIGQNSSLQTKIIAVFHSSPLGGHSSITPTYFKLKKHFAWKGMRQDVESYIKQCSVC